MKRLGIEFAPWMVPRERRLRTLATAAWITSLMFGPFLGIALAIFIIRTDYYFLMIIYVFYIARYRDQCNNGGKSWTWARKWRWWEYFRDFFPLKLVKTVDLDAEQNYLFCVFPHGVLCTGSFGSFATDALGFSDLFPNMAAHILTLGGHFMVPFFRELLAWLGMCSASAESINFLLDKEKGKGRCAVLMVGGAAESLNCHSGDYRVVLKKRKSFVKLAIKNGAALVPVISFGEIDLYEQLSNPPGGWVRRFQEWVKNNSGIAPVVPFGRGVFQYSLGILPQSRPVTTVVGKPIEVSKNLNPSQEEIDELHEKFSRELELMFEKEKFKYIKNAKETQLIVD